MMLIELTAVAAERLPTALLRDHLRLGTGFADDAETAPSVEAALRAAIAAIEARIGKALIARDFELTLPGWRDDEAEPLPLAPVRSVASVQMIDRAGIVTEVDPELWRLVRDIQRPRLAAGGTFLPSIPRGGTARIVFEAGFGEWAEVPVDLAQSVFMLAAQYYERRSEATGGEPMPFGVMALIERWRTIRTLGGGAR